MLLYEGKKLPNLSYLSISVDNIVVAVEHKYPSLRNKNLVQLALSRIAIAMFFNQSVSSYLCLYLNFPNTYFSFGVLLFMSCFFLTSYLCW